MQNENQTKWWQTALRQTGRYLKRVNHRFQLIRWFIFIGFFSFMCLSAFFTFKAKTADVDQIKINLQSPTVIYDETGQKAGKLYSQKGTYVELDQISKPIQDAVISTEDRTFYKNIGISFKGLTRAGINLIIHRGQISGGGSTITQQLAKNVKLTQEQTFTRKFAELFLAIQINKTYSKDDILTMYLNNAYFGNGVWGVQDASKRYFGKNASELDNSQAAVIAAMLRNPSFYNPADHLDNAKSRRDLILDLMVDNQKINTQEATAAKKEAIIVKNTFSQQDGYAYPYYFDEVVNEAVNQYDIKEEDLVKDGYKIYTALNQNQQQEMEKTFKESWRFPANATDGTVLQASSIAINPQTGGVSAVVGGRGKYTIRGYSRATQMKRQPGSAIKPLAVYTPALQSGYHYDSKLVDKKQSYGTNHYEPTNIDGKYSGEIPMYKALANSTNAPAVWLLDQIGVAKGVRSVENFGIDVSENDQNLAMALGGWQDGVSPKQMASAYTAFANDGELVETHFIKKIVDASGKVVVDNTQPSTKRIMTSKVATEMTSMMLDVYNSGTGVNAKPAGYKIAGKTGSTEVPTSYGYGTKDQWVIGYTPDIVVATWMGFDKTDKDHFMHSTSVNGVSPIFKAEMQRIIPTTSQTQFDTDDAQTNINNHGDGTSIWNNMQDDVKNGIGKATDGIRNGLDSAYNTANNWYNKAKDLFN